MIALCLLARGHLRKKAVHQSLSFSPSETDVSCSLPHPLSLVLSLTLYFSLSDSPSVSHSLSCLLSLALKLFSCLLFSVSHSQTLPLSLVFCLTLCLSLSCLAICLSLCCSADGRWAQHMCMYCMQLLVLTCGYIVKRFVGV